MIDIDNMDIFYYFEVLGYKLNKNKPRLNEKDVFIDELGWL